MARDLIDTIDINKMSEFNTMNLRILAGVDKSIENTREHKRIAFWGDKITKILSGQN